MHLPPSASSREKLRRCLTVSILIDQRPAVEFDDQLTERQNLMPLPPTLLVLPNSKISERRSGGTPGPLSLISTTISLAVY